MWVCNKRWVETRGTHRIATSYCLVLLVGRPASTFVDLSVNVPLIGSADLKIGMDFLISSGGTAGTEVADEVEDASDFTGGEFMVTVVSCSDSSSVAKSCSAPAPSRESATFSASGSDSSSREM